MLANGYLAYHISNVGIAIRQLGQKVYVSWKEDGVLFCLFENISVPQINIDLLIPFIARLSSKEHAEFLPTPTILSTERPREINYNER